MNTRSSQMPPKAHYDVFMSSAAASTDAVSRAMQQAEDIRCACARQATFARGTSSASTKLVHGGLRYLEHYQFRLVREALKEREVLWQMAPHIIWPLRFVLPHHKGLRPAWLLRLGLLHLRSSRRAAGFCPHPDAGPQDVTCRQARSSRCSRRRSNIPTAGWKIRDLSFSMPAMRQIGGGYPASHQGRVCAATLADWNIEVQDTATGTALQPDRKHHRQCGRALGRRSPQTGLRPQ
jgi:hypothetical protein